MGWFHGPSFPRSNPQSRMDGQGGDGQDGYDPQFDESLISPDQEVLTYTQTVVVVTDSSGNSMTGAVPSGGFPGMSSPTATNFGTNLAKFTMSASNIEGADSGAGSERIPAKAILATLVGILMVVADGWM